MKINRMDSLFTLGIFFVLLITIPITVTKAEPANPINVACVFVAKSLGAQDYNDMAYQGLLRAEQEGLCTFDYSHPATPAQYEKIFAKYADEGSYDLIIAIAFHQAPAVEKIAIKYPDLPIVILDYWIEMPGNVRSIRFRISEASFLVGAMAGLMSENEKVGFIGGTDIPLIREFWAGFVAGALYENLNIEYFENFVGSYTDPETGRAMAQNMWEQNIDIIYAAAGTSGMGVLESASEQPEGIYAIGVDSDQDYIYPGKILCSAVKKIDNMVYNAIRDVSTNAWTSGVHFLGVAENAVDISPLTYTADIIGPAKIEEVTVNVKNKIIDGSLPVPFDAASLEEWIANLNELTITAFSPIDLMVTDPDGLTISKDIIEIPEAFYNDTIDVNGDGDLDDQIIIKNRKIGDYLIIVVPNPDALPADTYTLEVKSGYATRTLIEDIQIDDIPNQPYIVRLSDTKIIPIISTTIDFDPDTLNLKSGSQWVSVFIELFSGYCYEVSDINIETVVLNDEVPAELTPTRISDHDLDGIPDLMVKFNFSLVRAILEEGELVTIYIHGFFTDGNQFDGKDTIRVINA